MRRRSGNCRALLECPDGSCCGDAALYPQLQTLRLIWQPRGRVYIMKDTISVSDSTGASPEQLLEVHVAILDGKAYFFEVCK